MKELSLNVLDIVQNSIRAGADNIRIEIRESSQSNSLIIKIIDNGSGMDEEILAKADDPFTTSRTTRKIGMGIPLLKYHAELTGGSLKIESKAGVGTAVTAFFTWDHIDRQPMGDICGVYRILLMAEKNIDFEFYHSTDKGEYEFKSSEAKKLLEIKDFEDYSLAMELHNLMKENLSDIGAELT